MTDIIFDLGGVLLDLNMEGVGEACKRLGINPELFFVKTPQGGLDEGSSTVCNGISASQHSLSGGHDDKRAVPHARAETLG